MGQYLNDGVTTRDGKFWPAGTSRDRLGDSAATIGDHLWTEQGPESVIDTARDVDLPRAISLAQSAFEKAPAGSGIEAAVRAILSDLGYAVDDPAWSDVTPAEEGPSQFQSVPVDETPVVKPADDGPLEVKPADPAPVDPPPPAPGSDSLTSQSDTGVPPRGGKGSSLEHWAAYARANGVTVTDAMKRDDVIEALELAKVPTESE